MASHILIHLILFALLRPSSSSSPFPPGSLPTRSGYLQVNSTSGSSIFYTFYEARYPVSSSISDTPLLVWLQGGPGCSSMLGNFFELGPWRVNRSILLEPNNGGWNRVFGLLFLDNPIGTGFSIASNIDEIPTDQFGVAKHLFTAIQGFIGLHPGFRTRPIYVTGESYAGKYAPAIGYYILKKNPTLPKKQRVNLAGIAVGNGLVDPVTQITTHAENAYFSGLINEKHRTELVEMQKKVVKLVEEGKWYEAADSRSEVLHMLQDMTGLATLFDIRRKTPYQSNLVEMFLSNGEVKRALGVNESRVWESCSEVVGERMQEDVMKSARFMVEFLLKFSKVLLYEGESDLTDGAVSNEAWMRKLKWENTGKFRDIGKVWKVGKDFAGYVQKWGSLSHVVVFGAGHFVPTDQSLNSRVMIEDWVSETGCFATHPIQ